MSMEIFAENQGSLQVNTPQNTQLIRELNYLVWGCESIPLPCRTPRNENEVLVNIQEDFSANITVEPCIWYNCCSGSLESAVKQQLAGQLGKYIKCFLKRMTVKLSLPELYNGTTVFIFLKKKPVLSLVACALVFSNMREDMH